MAKKIMKKNKSIQRIKFENLKARLDRENKKDLKAGFESKIKIQKILDYAESSIRLCGVIHAGFEMRGSWLNYEDLVKYLNKGRIMPQCVHFRNIIHDAEFKPGSAVCNSCSSGISNKKKKKKIKKIKKRTL